MHCSCTLTVFSSVFWGVWCVYLWPSDRPCLIGHCPCTSLPLCITSLFKGTPASRWYELAQSITLCALSIMLWPLFLSLAQASC